MAYKPLVKSDKNGNRNFRKAIERMTYWNVKGYLKACLNIELKKSQEKDFKYHVTDFIADEVACMINGEPKKNVDKWLKRR